MILRFYLVVGLILLGGTGYFIVVQTPPTVQAAPVVGDVSRLREEGLLPEGTMFENEEIEHDIFGVPPEDEAMIEAAMENMDMGGMDMGSMDMGSNATMDMAEGDTMDMGEGGQMDMAEGAVLDMDMDGDGVMDMSSAQMGANATMDMAEVDTMDMGEGGQMDMAEGAVLDMDMDGDGVMDMSSAQMGANTTMDMAEGDTMDMGQDGQMDMADGDGMDMAEGEEDHAEDSEAAEEEAARLMAGQMAGLLITDDGDFDREIQLSMSEWTFSDLELDAQPGEKIRFTLRNDGSILHEFMFMGMAQMQGVNYRAKRADWNLLEHEALFEQSLLLPGEEITFVAQVLRPGAWMFMCMLPYHMQMGMMGQLATDGMAMEM